MMITLDDCIAFCGLSEAEILAVAEHEHLPEVTAAALAQYLLARDHGAEKIRDMILDDIQSARARGDIQHMHTLLHVLHHFVGTHPEARPGAEPVGSC